ncbi:unnamed protein product, partial [Vitis vinifera]|uniref:Uncharacterized protein n=1 Tax=Vitis vinifera TaxID=29760 RepID=D7T3T0_VITVI
MGIQGCDTSLSFLLAGFAIFTNTALLCQFGCCVSICSIDNNFKSTPLKMSMSSTKLSKNHSNFFNMKLPRPHKCFQNLKKKHNGKSASATCQLHHPVSNFLLGISKSPAQRASKGVLCNPQRRHLHQRHINGLDRLVGFDFALLIDRLSNNINDAAKGIPTHRHGDRRTSIENSLSTHEPFRSIHSVSLPLQVDQNLPVHSELEACTWSIQLGKQERKQQLRPQAMRFLVPPLSEFSSYVTAEWCH